MLVDRDIGQILTFTLIDHRHFLGCDEASVLISSPIVLGMVTKNHDALSFSDRFRSGLVKEKCV